jgi:hypothetical protein
MKKTTLLVAVLAFSSLFAFAQDKDYYSGSFARLTYVKGDVVVERAGDLGSEAGVVNLALVEGDQVETKDGRAEVSFGHNNFLRIDSGTLVEFSNLPQSGDDRVRLHLLSGNLYLRVSYLQAEKSFEVHTPGASFYILEEGLYRFDARGNAETEISVLEGSAEAAGEGGSQLVGSRERLVATNGQLGSQSGLAHGGDDFDRWNEDRDAVEGRYASKRYLPAELDDYENELADNGSWAYERPYGYVWVPYVVSYPDWRPYYYGYWDWYPLCGWTWIPSEPWGWSVYHYGRWGWRLGLGWYWIPHCAWGPAWVHWYWGYDYCGWSPLSWYDYPCVLVDNYFYDRYHGGHYPCGSHAMTVIHKNQLQNRHISEVALSRAEAGRLGNVSMQAQQPDVKPLLRSSELHKGVSGQALSIQPTIRPSSLSKSGSVPTAASPSRITNSSLQKGSLSSGEQLKSRASSSRSTSGLGRNGDVHIYPPSRPVEKPVGNRGPARIESPGSAPSSPHQIRGFESRLEKGGISSPSAIRTYPSSSGIRTTDRFPSIERSSSFPREYSPSPTITRYGTSGGPSSFRSPERRASIFGQDRSISRAPSSRYSYYPSTYAGPSRDNFSGFRSSPSSSRLSSFLDSYSSSGSSSRSVFAAPRSSFSSRSNSPSFSRSSPSFSSGSGSFSSHSSSPSFSRSSSSHSPSGGSIRKK